MARQTETDQSVVPADRVWAMLDQLHSSVNEKLDAQLDTSGLVSLPFLGVLRELANRPDPTPARALLGLGGSQPGLSRRLLQMEQAGLIDRHTDPADARAHLVLLTAKGRAALRKATKVVSTTLTEQLGQRLSDRDLQSLDKVLRRQR